MKSNNIRVIYICYFFNISSFVRIIMKIFTLHLQLFTENILTNISSRCIMNLQKDIRGSDANE